MPSTADCWFYDSFMTSIEVYIQKYLVISWLSVNLKQWTEFRKQCKNIKVTNRGETKPQKNNTKK